LAASIDAAIIGAAALCFAAASAASAARFATPTAAAALQDLPLPSALGTLALTVAALALAYQLLFFTFSDATPGMRLAHVGLCTFADENPTRRAMRLRVLALVLSTVTLGLGHLWALLDQDRLTWHDLISRMYPRSY
ncbi:MAG: RDD family protein, partial [Acidobacteriota bacterium]|nr:RDD family protein [Acidobacteriota bacterium]